MLKILKHKYLFIFISGLLFSAPFIFPELNLLSFISGVPFFIILFDEIINKKKNKIIRHTFVFGMSFYLPVYVWFLRMYPMEQTGVTPFQSLLIVTAAWFGFSLLQTFVMLILPVGFKIFKNLHNNNENSIKSIFFLPVLTSCLYVILEWVQSWFLSGLTWAKLSISQYKDLFFIQSISLFGTYFTSFIIIFINASIAVYFLNKHKNQKNNILILAVILLYFANSYFGYFRIMYYDYIDRTSERQQITAQIIQGNVSSYEKWEDSGGQNSLEIYSKLITQYNNENADICVLPETAIPYSITRGSSIYNALRSLASENNITIFTGIIYYDEETDKRYNALMAFDKNYDFVQPYGKRHLVPFGEYLPLEKIITKYIPFVENISLLDSVLTPGESSDIMNINGVNYGGLICFDSIFPELARKSVQDGADILLISTNDSWFRDSTAIEQHNAQAVLRAVENNRYVIRSANTGVSSFISNTGKILQQSDVLQREVLTGKVGIVKHKTVYTMCGDIILYLSLAFIVFCVYLGISKYIKQKLREKKS